MPDAGKLGELTLFGVPAVVLNCGHAVCRSCAPQPDQDKPAVCSRCCNLALPNRSVCMQVGLAMKPYWGGDLRTRTCAMPYASVTRLMPGPLTCSQGCKPAFGMDWC